MKEPSREEQKRLVQQWAITGRELERIRREALRGMPYNAEDVDALLSLGDHYAGPPDDSRGLIEMQRLFMVAADRQGLRKRTPPTASTP